eukprot:scaffold79940_cov35-Tisochrysis_lutea.AAC.2
MSYTAARSLTRCSSSPKHLCSNKHVIYSCNSLVRLSLGNALRHRGVCVGMILRHFFGLQVVLYDGSLPEYGQRPVRSDPVEVDDVECRRFQAPVKPRQLDTNRNIMSAKETE